MAKFIDLDRDRQEKVMVNWHGLFLAVEALSTATGQPSEILIAEIAKRANAHVDGCNDLQVRAAMKTLDLDFD